MVSTISMTLERCELTGFYLNEVEQSFRSNGESGKKRKVKIKIKDRKLRKE